MAIDKAKLDIWLEKGRQWLNAFDEFKIRQSIQSLILQLDEVLKKGDYTPAWYLIKRLQDLTDEIQGDGSAEIPERSGVRVECAIAAYRMGNLQEAIRLFETAIEIYGPKYGGHYAATVKWMLGCVQWQAPHQEDHAIASWDKSIEIYHRLKYQSLEHVSSSRSAWYADRVVEMSRALNLAIQPSDPLQSPGTSSSEHVSSTPPVDPPHTERSSTSGYDVLQLFSISAEIQAGELFPSFVDSSPLGYIEIDQFQINGLIHRIVNLRGPGHVIKISPSKGYKVIKVNGQSMNADGIDDGDYVLLCLQNTADDNDIVAATINGIDTEATLKRFFKRRGKIILEFRSDDPIYKDAEGKNRRYEFTASVEGFQIAGVALAVFKPI